MLCGLSGYHPSSEIFGYCQFWMFNCTESLKSRNWISILMELIFSSSSWLITECQPEPSGWNPVGAVVSGASHYLCVDSQGCRRWVPVSKTAMSLSQIESDDKNSGLCTPLWKQYLQTWKPALFSVGEYWQFKQRFLFSNFHLWEATI